MRDDGYFPEGSVLRKVHRERAVGLMFGQRALMIGALNPRAFVGTLENTKGRLRPFARLAHTGKVFETIFFGTRAEADQALAFVHRLHERVNGEMPERVGAVPAGASYSAFDPDLMLWTMAVIADSALYFYELFVGELDAEQRESLWQDYVRFAELFGMPRDAAPASHAEFRAWWQATLASEEMCLSEEARFVGYASALEIPHPRTHDPAFAVHNLVMMGSMPPVVREHYGLGWGRAQELAFRAAVAGLKRAVPVIPSRIRRGYNTESFDMVARIERERIARGDPTPQAPVAQAS